MADKTHETPITCGSHANQLPTEPGQNHALLEVWQYYNGSVFPAVFEQFQEYVPENYRFMVHAAVLVRGRKLRSFLYYLFRRNYWDEHDEAAAFCLELMHEASINLDDIVDGEPMRHGVKTFTAEFGVDMAALTASLMQNSALSVLHQYFPDQVHSTLAAIGSSHKAELHDAIGKPADDAVNWWFQNVLPKTTGIFDVAAQLLGRAFEMNEEPVIKSFFHTFGQYYQISNDIFDFLYTDGSDRGEFTRLSPSLPLCVAVFYAGQPSKEEVLARLGTQMPLVDVKTIVSRFPDCVRQECARVLDQYVSAVDERIDALSEVPRLTTVGKDIRSLFSIVNLQDYWCYTYSLPSQ